jgi:hypothetical protein
MSNIDVETRELTVGIKTRESVKIYPLSFAAQKEFTKQISEMLETFAKKEQDASTIDIVKMIFQLIEDNLIKIMKLVADYDVELNNIDNNQISELCTIIFEMNYETPVKNVQSLKKRISDLWT